MTTTVPIHVVRGVGESYPAKKSPQHDAPRNNKQAQDRPKQLMAEMCESFDSQSDSSEVYSIVNFDIVRENNPGNRPFNSAQNNCELVTLRNLVKQGAYNPFEFGQRRGYGDHNESHPDLRAHRSSKDIFYYQEDCMLQDLLKIQSVPPLPPHQSMQMVVEECAHLDPSRVGGHSHYASKPFDNLSKASLPRENNTFSEKDSGFMGSGRHYSIVENLQMEDDEDVQIPDNCELLSDRMNSIKSLNRVPLASPFSSKANSGDNSATGSKCVSPILTSQRPAQINVTSLDILPERENFGSQESHLRLLIEPGVDILGSKIESQLISLKSTQVKGLASRRN